MKSSSPGLGAETSRSLRIGATILLLLPVLAVLTLAFRGAIQPGAMAEIPCWILPNGRVVESPANLNCPIAANDLIRGLEASPHSASIGRHSEFRRILLHAGDQARIEVRREGRSLWLDVPVRRPSSFVRFSRLASAAIATLFLLGIPLLLLWRSTWRASLPLAISYTVVATVSVTILSAQNSDTANQITFMSLVFMPAALAHLALTFPREREIVRKAPRIQALPYAAALPLLPVAWFALERSALLWPPFMYLLLALTAGAWIVLMLSCSYALGETTSAVEYARARLFLIGGLMIPLIPTLGFALVSEKIVDAALLYLWILPIFLPIPIALAIGLHDLFDLGANLRFAVARMLYIALSALSLTIILKGVLDLLHQPIEGPDLTLLFPVALGGVLVLEPLRTRLSQRIENTLAPRQRELRKSLADLARDLATLRDEDTAMRLIAASLERGITAGAGCLLIRNEDLWRPAHLFGGHPPKAQDWAREAIAALDGETWLHLAMLETARSRAPNLCRVGIEAIATIDDGDRILGLLLLGSGDRRKPFLGVELEFLKGISSQASVALSNARLSEELLAAEEQAATGRLALGIAHDVGKELIWIRRLASRLPDLVDDPDRLKRDSRMLAEFSQDILLTLRRFVEDATQTAARHGVPRCLDQLTERAMRQVERQHGKKCISSVLDPTIRKLPCQANFGRALFNLLDNAVHASPEDETVRLFATREESGWLRVEIEDRGSGIATADRSRVFETGYTTRRERGGSGVGLGVARDILASLGGEIELLPAQPHGLQARIRLPIAPSSKGEA